MVRCLACDAALTEAADRAKMKCGERWQLCSPCRLSAQGMHTDPDKPDIDTIISDTDEPDSTSVRYYG